MSSIMTNSAVATANTTLTATPRPAEKNSIVEDGNAPALLMASAIPPLGDDVELTSQGTTQVESKDAGRAGTRGF